MPTQTTSELSLRDAIALARPIAEAIIQARSQPRAAATVVATAIHRELRRAGYTDTEIFSIVNEILGCLVDSLKQLDQGKP